MRPFERVTLHRIDPTDKQPNGQYRHSKYLWHEKKGGIGRSQEPHEAGNHESQTSARDDAIEHIEDAIEHIEEVAGSPIDVERKQRERVELVSRQGLQVPRPSQDEGGREVEKLRERDGGGGHESEQHARKARFGWTGRSKTSQEKGQRNICDGLPKIGEVAWAGLIEDWADGLTAAF